MTGRNKEPCCYELKYTRRDTTICCARESHTSGRVTLSRTTYCSVTTYCRESHLWPSTRSSFRGRPQTWAAVGKCLHLESHRRSALPSHLCSCRWGRSPLRIDGVRVSKKKHCKARTKVHGENKTKKPKNLWASSRPRTDCPTCRHRLVSTHTSNPHSDPFWREKKKYLFKDLQNLQGPESPGAPVVTFDYTYEYDKHAKSTIVRS